MRALRVTCLAALALATPACGGETGESSPEKCKPAQGTIAYQYDGGGSDLLPDLYLVKADGTGQRALVEDAFEPVAPGAHAWSPDGCRIAFASDGLYVINANGGDMRPLIPPAADASTPRAVAATWSPDGRKIALTVSQEEELTDGSFAETSNIDVLDADGRNRHRLVSFPAGDPSWSPDGRIAFARWFSIDVHDVYVVNPDGSALQRLTRRLPGSAGSSHPAWSPDGRSIAFLGSDGSIHVIDADGSGLRRVTRNPLGREAGSEVPFSWSPDGTRIAFVRRTGEGDSDIYVVNADGTRLRRLTRSGKADEPTWSPNARQIAFVEFEHGDLAVMNADGRGLHRLTKTPVEEHEPVWSPR